MCDAAVAPLVLGVSSKEQADHKSHLQILDWRIRNLSTISGCDEFGPDSEAKLKLYRLAMLIYLNRASENALSQTAAKTQEQLHTGLRGPQRWGARDGSGSNPADRGTWHEPVIQLCQSPAGGLLGARGSEWS